MSSDLAIRALQEQGPAIERAAALLRERVDVFAILDEAGVDLSGVDAVTVEIEPEGKSDGIGPLKKGDGKGCVRVCVNVGFVKFCYKNCDD